MVSFSTIALLGCSSSAASNEHRAVSSPSLFGRATPLSFGVHVTPDPNENPIDPPERFTGFHAATDFEVSQSELTEDVAVYAVCSGTIMYSGFAEGYGGLLTESCTIDGEDVTIIYGHLTIEGLPASGTDVKKKQKIAILAPARTRDSDQNRKHLHLGIRKGHVSDVRGYVQSEAELSQFVDPAEVLSRSPLPSAEWFMEPYWKSGTGSTAS